MRSARLVLVLGMLALVAGAVRPSVPAAGDEAISVTDIPLANGAIVRTLLATPSDPPHAVLIMFSGGDGVLHIRPSGEIGDPGNFLVRTRDLWVQHGFAVVIPDAPSDDPAGLQGRRLTAAYADVIARVVQFARDQTKVPAWSVGTSAGSPAAAQAAATQPRDAIAGLVLTSSATRSVPDSPDTVFRVDLKKITVPTLVLSNLKDECQSTPPGDGPRIKAAISNANPVEFQTVSGGSVPTSAACEAFSYHGFYGIEDQVVQKISDWIVAHS